MDNQNTRQWVGEARLGSRRTLVTFQLPQGTQHVDVEMEGSIPRIDGVLRPDIPVKPLLGKSRGAYERPAAIDNTRD